MKRLTKILSLLMTVSVTVMLFASCGGAKKSVSDEDGRLMAGRWNAVLCRVYGIVFTPDQGGQDMVLDFREDGTLDMTVNGSKSTSTWKKNGDTITADGTAMKLSGEALRLDIDEDGLPMTMYFAKPGSAAAEPKQYIENGDLTYEDLSDPTPETARRLLEKVPEEGMAKLGLDAPTVEMIKRLAAMK